MVGVEVTVGVCVKVGVWEGEVVGVGVKVTHKLNIPGAAPPERSWITTPLYW